MLILMSELPKSHRKIDVRRPADTEALRHAELNYAAIGVVEMTFGALLAATGYVTTAERAPNWQTLKDQLPPGTPRPSSIRKVGAVPLWAKTTFRLSKSPTKMRSPTLSGWASAAI